MLSYFNIQTHYLLFISSFFNFFSPMKFSQILLFVLSFSLVAFTANDSFAQASKTQKLIAKKWDLDTDAFKAMLQAEIAKKAEEDPGSAEMAKAMMDRMMEQMKDVSFDFKPDGKMNVGIFGKEEGGTWKLSPDGKTILITGPNGQEQEMLIVELTKDKLVFGKEGEEMKLPFKPSAKAKGKKK
jgi:hypothetical protein